VTYCGAVPPAAVRPKSVLQPVPAALVPDWARTSAPVEARPPRPLAPSAILDEALPSPPPGPAQAEAARRGVLLHRLFERLPGVEPELGLGSALRWLERSAGVADAAYRSELAEAACAVVGDPAFAELFGPSSLAEAPIAATLDDGRVVAGTVDRLLVEPSTVRVIDFKTGARVPVSPADVPPAHIAQMHAYAEALRMIFPGRTVEAALLYTAGPNLIPIAC
jgi:ATP-dependent helicase/nuclease subunit A